MANYTYRSVKALTGEPVADLQLADVTYARGLGGSGFLNATLSLSDPSATPENLSELSREIEVFRNGVPVWVGPILNVQPSLANRNVAIQAAPTWWWMTHRTVELDLTYTNADLAVIAWEVIDTANQKVPNGDVRILQHPNYPAAAGQTWTGTLPAYQRKYVSDIISELSQQFPGFDYDVQYFLDRSSNQVVRYFQMYPGLKGILADQHMTAANGVSDIGFASDGTRAVNRVHELGAGSGDSQLIVSQDNTDYTADLPMIEEVVSRTDVTDLATLGLYAEADLFLRRWPSRIYSATFTPTEALPFGFAQYGDTVPLDIDLGGWSFTTTKRVISESITVGRNGAESITYSFNEV